MKKLEKPFLQFIFKYTVIHTITYLLFGILFMLISDYFDFFARDPILSNVMKPADALSVRLAPFAQIIRGSLLATAIYPFRSVIIDEKYGWLKLFWLMYVLTSIGSVITGPGSMEGFLYTKFSYNPLIGVPEITLQMLAFSWIFYRWQGSNPSNLNQ